MNIRRKTIKALEDAGYRLFRNGAKHDVYRNPETGKQITVKRHNFDESTARYLMKEAGLK
ncbi:MAG: type II toxin-antitoxin system HicA family toxin [Eubacteriales bacterium]|nr:type II toxin-antitoxin system HicA family toxin [Eubacteriales bacterium]